MPRKSIINGNGFCCDICGKDITSWDVIRIRTQILVDSMGGLKSIDSMGVCPSCYKKEFPSLCGRGLLRAKKDRIIDKYKAESEE